MKKHVNSIMITVILIATLITVLTTSCGNKKTSSRVREEYDDGSKLITINDYSCFHKLFNDIGVYISDANFQIASFPEEYYPETYGTQWKVDSENFLTDIGYYEKYAFSDNGYVAFYNYLKGDDSGEYCIYSVINNTMVKFASMTELCEYAKKNNITLGQWYYNFSPEETIDENGDWTIVTTDDKITAVRNKEEDIFAGKIDKFISGDHFIAFHIYIDDSMQSKLRAFENPVLPCSEDDQVIGYTFLFRLPIYCDRYVVINTNDDSYKFFDSKRDTEKYLKNNNMSEKWQKVKYTGNSF